MSASLAAIDFKHLWHPFTQTKHWLEDGTPLIVERGEGFELIDVDGARYLDGVSSLWCNVHGHGVEELKRALHEQVETLCHSTLLGLSHRPIIELTEALVPLLPEGLTRIFYADDGSTAVEAALRIALEWWQKQGTPAGKRKNRLASLEDAYHGDTLGAVGVGYLKTFHRHCDAAVIPALRIPPPHFFRFYEGLSDADASARSLAALDELLRVHGEELAAFIIEPLVQGAAGILTHSEAYLREVVTRCRAHDVLVIADEVATGFGKTGSLFAVQRAGVVPDLLVMGKGLGAGYLPISAVATNERIFDGFTGDVTEYRTFFYGQTFAGNPLAARLATANLALIRSSQLLKRLPEKLVHFHRAIADRVGALSHVDEIRSCGVMVGIELTATAGARVPYPVGERVPAKIVLEARRRGAIIRPLGNVMVLMPAPAMGEADLQRLVEITAESIAAVTEAFDAGGDRR